METIKNLAIDTQLVKDNEGSGCRYIFKNNKDMNTAMSAGFAESLDIQGGDPKSFIIWF